MGTKQDDIRIRAHQIWEEKGRPEGDGFDHWLEAEKELAEHDDDRQDTDPQAPVSVDTPEHLKTLHGDKAFPDGTVPNPESDEEIISSRRAASVR